MAGNSNSGNVLAFKLSEKELETKLNTYKTAVESGEIPRASWANLCAYLGYTEIEVGEVIARDQVNSAYYSRAVALKRALTWVRGQLASGNGWSGQNQSRAIFLLKQDPPLQWEAGRSNPMKGLSLQRHGFCTLKRS